MLVVELGRERAGADPGGVRLDDADHLGDPGRPDAGADAGAARGRVRRGDERIGAVIDVEQRPLRALEEHGRALVEGLAEDEAGVGHVRPHPLAVGQVVVGDLPGVDAAPVVDLGQHLVLVPQGELELLPEDAGIEQVLDPDADPGDLVAVGRADAPAGGADLRVAEEPLADLIQRPVVGHDQVRVGADEQPVAAHAALLQRVDLLEQRLRVDDHAVADDGGDVRGEHTGREDVQRVLLLADHDRVAGVVAALVPDDVLHAVPEQVGRLALTLVAPLGADQHDGRHSLHAFHTTKAPGGASATGALAL